MSDIMVSQDFLQLHIAEVGPTIIDEYSWDSKAKEDVHFEELNDDFGVILLCHNSF